MSDDLPRAVVDEAERLTRRARATDDDAAADRFREHRARLLAEHDFVGRVRDSDESLRTPGGTSTVSAGTGQNAGTGRNTGTDETAGRGRTTETDGSAGSARAGDRDVLVLHPAEWIEDGTIRVDRVDDLSRAVERPLGGDPPEWEGVESHNREIATMVERERGEVHGANAHAFADFMGNHYARRVEAATGPEVEEFLEEYFPRNAWPSEAQRATVLESLEHVFGTAGEEPPPLPDAGERE